MTEIRFVRHGHTLKAAQDEERKLSEVGILQSVDLGFTWLHEAFSPELVMTSRAQQAQQTAEIVTRVHLMVLEELYFGTDPDWRSPIEESSAKLGYAPLAAYLTSEAKGAIRAYAAAAATKILNLVRERPNASKAAVFGHAVLLQAIAVELLRHDPNANLDAILQLNLGECEVITVRL